MSPRKIEGQNLGSREDLFRHLDAHLRSHGSEAEERNLLKTYILEIASPPNGGTDGRTHKEMLSAARDLFSSGANSPVLVDVLSKKEDYFFEARGKSRRGSFNLYLDAASDQRFWFVYTTSDSALVDSYLSRLTRERRRIDHAWLWPGFLEKTQQEGIPRGFGLDYDFRKFGNLDDEEVATYLKMQIWGGRKTSDLYQYLRKHPHFKSRVVLSKVRFKQTTEAPDRPLFAIQDLKFNGKFTVRGNHLKTHLATLLRVREAYRASISSIEQKYTIRPDVSRRGVVGIEGEGINFIPDGFELNVRQLTDRMLDGTNPFRLWGLASFPSKDHAVCDVVDMHTGGSLRMDIFSDLITVYLRNGSCGNAIARLYTNLQHYYSHDFKAEGDGGEAIF